MPDLFIFGGTQREYIPYEKTVVEKRAPTDDSIRIYEEIKEKAFKSILDSATVSDNKLNYKYQIYKDHYNYKTILHFSVSLNGTEYVDKIDIDFDISDKYRIVQEIYRKVTDKLSYSLLKDLKL